MYEDRPSRSRKQVDYAKFGGGFDDGDDDFADATPPAAKKPKKEKLKKDKKSSKPNTEKDDFQPSVKVGRVPLDEKLFDRQLQEALELSKVETGHSQEDSPPTLDNMVVEQVQVDVEILPHDLHSNKENSPKREQILKPQPVLTTNKKSSSSLMPDLEMIEVLEEDVVEKRPAQGRSRRAAAKPKAKKYVDDYDDELSDSEANSDDDFKVDEKDASSDEDPAEEEDFDPDEESDYEGGSKKRKRGKSEPAKKAKSTPKPKKAAVGKKSTPAPAPAAKVRGGLTKSHTSSPVTPNMPSLHKVTPASQRKPLVKTPAMPTLSKASPLAAARRPALPLPAGKSPGLGGVVIKSPGSATSGVLRPGLSRRAHIKPLHANVKLS